MNKYLEIGMDAFNASFVEELAKGEGKVFRAGGRPTKAMPNGEDDKWWRENPPAMIQSWISWRQQNPNLHVWSIDDVPAIELPVQAEIAINDGTVVLLKGFIDRVFVDANTGELLICDLKTGKNTPSFAAQLAFYRRALKSTHGVNAQYGAYWMARTGALSEVHNLDNFSDDIVDYWVRTTYAGVSQGLFLPNVTNLCKGCGVRKHCYVFNPDAKFSPINARISEQIAGGDDE